LFGVEKSSRALQRNGEGFEVEDRLKNSMGQALGLRISDERI
jgi:hypothetical protein